MTSPSKPLKIAVLGPANVGEFRQDLQNADYIPEGLGGVPVNELVRNLLDLGHSVSLFTASRGISSAWMASGPMLDVFVAPFRPGARSRALDMFRVERRALEAMLKGSQADVYHAHWTYEFTQAAISARVGPLLVTAHDAPFTILNLHRDAYRLMRTVMAVRARIGISELTAVAPYLAHKWRRQMFYRRGIRVIPNSIPALPPHDRATPGHAVVLDVADGGERKNVRTLIAAIARVRQSVPAVELRLVGHGLETDSPIARWADEVGLAAGVTFLGPLGRDDVAKEYARADVFCHPSLEEAQPMVLLEALSQGLAVVAGVRSGGVPWTLFDGRAGLLVDVTDPIAIEGGILHALSRPGATIADGFDLHEELQKRYSGGAVAAAYIDEYRRLIAAPR